MKFIKENGRFFFGVLVIIAIIILFFYDDMQPRNQYLKDAFVSEGQITLKTTDNSGNLKYYVKISLVNPSVKNVQLLDDMSYAEVTAEYYNKHQQGDAIGVLVGNYDVFKEKFFGWFNLGQDLEKNVWGIEDVFDSKQKADEAFPYKEFTDKALLVTKAAAENIFVLNYDEREIVFNVGKEVFDKYNENDYVECNFQSLGDLIKVTEVK